MDIKIKTTFKGPTDFKGARNGWDDTSRFKLRPLNTLENGYLWEVYK